ncbi:DUF308 domain-containing protein [Pseudonocardia hydrocarbonoxydans]|uniref:HdeD family acid-resistance protein n=1 Tax=Pseudonocardia hydrocarbonoxydans TaxID=76726 RepID=A0A4Y3WRN8_9PSEU|nr:DUF308 domain-containing protein [Pseudonocardia hydrocarbonoxydans]GEC20459.1 hypothetical protein PHY01_27420 [Pseudonocardia hydrocarbonoxydans]
MSSTTAPEPADPAAAARPDAPARPDDPDRTGWWAMLVIGVLTVLYGLLVMSLRPAALASVAVLAGIGFVVAGGVQFLIAGGMDRRWRWIAYAGGVLAVGAGVAAVVWPGPTLYVLAVVTAWGFVFNGLSRIIGTLVDAKRGLWWLGLVLGLFELLIGVWAIGSPLREVLLFVNLVGIFLILCGVDAIVLALGGRSEARTGAHASRP